MPLPAYTVSSAPSPGPTEGRIALLVDVGRDTAELLALWLASAGLEVSQALGGAERPALLLAERAYPRRDEQGWLQRLATRWPGIPVILLSPTVFASVPARGALATELGVAAVLATPLGREQLLRTVAEVLAA